ncbi:hypothetical protein S245_022010 [Arachis hypogaea]
MDNSMPMLSCLLFLFLQCGFSSSNMDIFILAGQSNMAGRGGVKNGRFWDGNVPPECRSNPSILRLSASLQWEEAHEPLHLDIDLGKTCGVGPGLAFANEVLRIKGESVNMVMGLVPCAKGGTKIGEWSKGTSLYNELVRRAIESVKGNSGRTIRALLWYQGESDTVREEDAEGYSHNMEKFIMDLRSDLHLPNLLVIQVALASGEGKYIEKVRKGQLGLKLPNVKCVDAKATANGHRRIARPAKSNKI